MMYHSSSQLVDGYFLLSGEAQDVNSGLQFMHSKYFSYSLIRLLLLYKLLFTYISRNELFYIIDALDSDFTLTDHWVVIRVCGD